MSWLRSSRGLTVCLLAAMPLLAEDAALPAYVPRDARLLIGLRVRSLADALAAQGIDQEARAEISGLLAQTPLAGFDLFHDVDEILLVSTGEGQNPPTMVVMTGRFDAAAFSSGAKPYRNALILESQGSQEVTAFVDANTMLAGDLPLVRAALDGAGKGAPIDPALAARAAALRGRYAIWGAGAPPPGAKLPAGAEPWESIDSFGFGVAFSHGLECVADLHVRTPKDLEKLNSSLRLLEAMLKAQPAGGIESRFDLRTENGAIHVSLSVPEEALKKAVAAQRASLASAMAARLAAPTTPRKSVTPGKTEIVQDAAGNTLFVTLPGKE